MLRNTQPGFPGGLVLKNPSTNARDMSLIPGPGRSHMQGNNQAQAPQLLSPSVEPVNYNYWSLCVPWSPRSSHSIEDPAELKVNRYIFSKKAKKYTTQARYKTLHFERAWSLLVQKWVLEVCSLGCYSVAKLCPTLFDSMDWRMPGVPVLHQ